MKYNGGSSIKNTTNSSFNTSSNTNEKLRKLNEELDQLEVAVASLTTGVSSVNAKVGTDDVAHQIEIAKTEINNAIGESVETAELSATDATITNANVDNLTVDTIDTTSDRIDILSNIATGNIYQRYTIIVPSDKAFIVHPNSIVRIGFSNKYAIVFNSSQGNSIIITNVSDKIRYFVSGSSLYINVTEEASISCIGQTPTITNFQDNDFVFVKSGTNVLGPLYADLAQANLQNITITNTLSAKTISAENVNISEDLTVSGTVHADIDSDNIQADEIEVEDISADRLNSSQIHTKVEKENLGYTTIPAHQSTELYAISVPVTNGLWEIELENSLRATLNKTNSAVEITYWRSSEDSLPLIGIKNDKLFIYTRDAGKVYFSNNTLENVDTTVEIYAPTSPNYPVVEDLDEKFEITTNDGVVNTSTTYVKDIVVTGKSIYEGEREVNVDILSVDDKIIAQGICGLENQVLTTDCDGKTVWAYGSGTIDGCRNRVTTNGAIKSYNGCYEENGNCYFPITHIGPSACIHGNFVATNEYGDKVQLTNKKICFVNGCCACNNIIVDNTGVDVSSKGAKLDLSYYGASLNSNSFNGACVNVSSSEGVSICAPVAGDENNNCIYNNVHVSEYGIRLDSLTSCRPEGSPGPVTKGRACICTDPDGEIRMKAGTSYDCKSDVVIDCNGLNVTGNLSVTGETNISGAITANCFCGTATGADNATCFNGCTYSEACIDIRDGLATQTCADAIQNCANFIQSCVSAIEEKIPAQASASNQLADKDFVNSSIATNTANFRGTYACVAELPSTGNTNNDYAFICSLNTATGNYIYDRYKWVASASCWECEYELNTTGFTAEQLASINSGITSNLVAKITDVYDNTVTVCMNGASKGSFNLNQNTNATIDLGCEICNAKCFDGCTYADAKADIRAGLLAADNAASLCANRILSWDATNSMAKTMSTSCACNLDVINNARICGRLEVGSVGKSNLYVCNDYVCLKDCSGGSIICVSDTHVCMRTPTNYIDLADSGKITFRETGGCLYQFCNEHIKYSCDNGSTWNNVVTQAETICTVCSPTGDAYSIPLTWGANDYLYYIPAISMSNCNGTIRMMDYVNGTAYYTYLAHSRDKLYIGNGHITPSSYFYPNTNCSDGTMIWHGDVDGTVSHVSKVETASNTTNATFYPTFVDSNNGTAADECVYTDADLNYNPSTNTLSVPNVIASGTVQAAGSVCGNDFVANFCGFVYTPVSTNEVYLYLGKVYGGDNNGTRLTYALNGQGIIDSGEITIINGANYEPLVEWHQSASYDANTGVQGLVITRDCAQWNCPSCYYLRVKPWNANCVFETYVRFLTSSMDKTGLGYKASITGTAYNNVCGCSLVNWSSAPICAAAFYGDLHGDFYGCFCGAAAQVKTTATSCNANYYLTFVDSNNNSATAENVYTASGLAYNPFGNSLTAASFKHYQEVPISTPTFDTPFCAYSVISNYGYAGVAAFGLYRDGAADFGCAAIRVATSDWGATYYNYLFSNNGTIYGVAALQNNGDVNIFAGSCSVCLCCANGVLYLPQGANVPTTKATNTYDRLPVATCVDGYVASIHCLSCYRTLLGSLDLGSGDRHDWYNVISIRHGNGMGHEPGDGINYGLALYTPLTNANNTHICYIKQVNGTWSAEQQLIDTTGGQTINGNLTIHNSSNNACLTTDKLCTENACIGSITAHRDHNFIIYYGAEGSGNSLYLTCSGCFLSCSTSGAYFCSNLDVCCNLNVCGNLTIGCILCAGRVYSDYYTSGWRGYSWSDAYNSAGFIVNNQSVCCPQGQCYVPSFVQKTCLGYFSLGVLSSYEKWMITYNGGCSITEVNGNGTICTAGKVQAACFETNCATLTSSANTPISLTCGGYKLQLDCAYDTALGFDAVASGESATAIGDSSRAIGSCSVALGCGAESPAAGSIAIGCETCATGTDNIAIGCGVTTCCPNAIAIGCGTVSRGDSAIVIGCNAQSDSGSATAIGSGASAKANGVSIGTEAKGCCDCSIAIGYKACARATNSIIMNAASESGSLYGTYDGNMISVKQLYRTSDQTIQHGTAVMSWHIACKSCACWREELYNAFVSILGCEARYRHSMFVPTRLDCIGFNYGCSYGEGVTTGKWMCIVSNDDLTVEQSYSCGCTIQINDLVAFGNNSNMWCNDRERVFFIQF